MYHAKRRDFLTSHQLIDFQACPLRYHMRMEGLIPAVQSGAFLTGQATHTLTLEGREAFAAEYVVGGPINPKTDRPYGRDTQKYAEWERQQGKPCLSEEQLSLVSAMAYAVRQHPVASYILAAGVAEGVLRADYLGAACQIRCDWFSPNFGLVDLKTCDDLDGFADAFARYSEDEGRLVVQADCTRFHYREQLAFYRELIYLNTGERAPVRLIAVEKKEPHRVGVWQIDVLDLQAARERNEKAIRRLLVCRNCNTWPTNYEDERTLPPLEIAA